MLAAIGCAGLFLVCGALGADGPPLLPPPPLPSPPALKSGPEPVVSPARKPRHYIVQVKLIEVDSQGRESVLGEPQLKTAGGNAGVAIDHPDGRHFEFTVRLSDRTAVDDDSIPAKVFLSSVEEALFRKLDQKIDLNLQQQSRRDVLREISRRAGIPFAIDPESSRSIARDLETATTVTAKDEAVCDLLDRLLQPANLSFLVQNDVVLISATDNLAPPADDFTIKNYHVADLVQTTGDAGEPILDFAPLVKQIKMTVQPLSWDRKDGPASIRPFTSTQSIVVRQTPQGHAAIDRLLDKIRREQPKPTAE